MRPFDFAIVEKENELFKDLAAGGKVLAGGTTLIDLMKLEVETPKRISDIARLPWADIEKTSEGGLRIGAMVTNTDLAHHAQVRKHYKVLSEAILAGASGQLRNKATTGGNLLQRTRCPYFRDTTKACNKREPASGCPAIEGHNRNLAILGTSTHCIATNPSDMNVAMLALDAQVHLKSEQGERTVPVADFHLLPGKTPHIETVLKPGELITAVTLPPPPEGSVSLYLKLRDRASYEFALASAAIMARKSKTQIESVSIAMGGLGTKPWRVEAAESLLLGQKPSEALFNKAAEVFLADAKAYSENGFKIELARRCLVRALTMAFDGRRNA